MRLLMICGPWGSGTTAAANLLADLGVRGAPPYFQTFDPRTENSYESLVFRQVVQSLVSEEALTLLPGMDEGRRREVLRSFRQQLEASSGAGDWMFLKYPLSALIIPDICREFETRLIYVIRPPADIEATRVRRGWPPRFGAKGAEVIYSSMFRAFIDHDFPTLFVRFSDLSQHRDTVAREIIRFADMTDERLGDIRVASGQGD
jgi:hypothetical protein